MPENGQNEKKEVDTLLERAKAVLIDSNSNKNIQKDNEHKSNSRIQNSNVLAEMASNNIIIVCKNHYINC